MIVRVPDLKEEVRRIEFAEPAAQLNARIESSALGDGQRFVRDLDVDAEIYRSGHDVHFSGEIAGTVRAACGRCLDEFDRPLRRDFRFVILPRDGAGDDTGDDLGVDHYSGDELDLGPLVREQSLLALESIPLCSEGCRGLCSRCGANLNREQCECAARSSGTQ